MRPSCWGFTSVCHPPHPPLIEEGHLSQSIFLFTLHTGLGGEEEDDEEEEEDEEDIDSTPVIHPTMRNALEQVRGKSETVYEPFVLQNDKKVFIIFWKCEGFTTKVDAEEKGILVEVTVIPPTEEKLREMGLELPQSPLIPLRSRFRVALDCRVIAGSLKGENKPPFLVFTLEKYRESVSLTM